MISNKLFRIFFYFSTVSVGLGLKCFVCNSKMNFNCLDPFNASQSSNLLQNCESGHLKRFGSGGNGRTLDMVDIIMQTGDESSQKETVISSEYSMDVNNASICQKIIVTVGDELITSRGCSPQSVDGMHPCDAVRLSDPEHVQNCVTCPLDACNVAPKVITASYSQLMFIDFIFFIFFVFIDFS